MIATFPVPELTVTAYDSGPEILSPAAAEFLRALHARFETRRQGLLKDRRRLQEAFDYGAFPGFIPETRHIRERMWQVAPVPPELLDRRVEITGPPERRMVIRGLNSGARVYVADFEDANSPTWDNCIDGQRNLIDANRRTINWRSADGRRHEVGADPAVLFVRPRGWHMIEKHFLGDGTAISASLFDFGLYFLHNCQMLLDRGSAPYFYLPKLESRQEARLWNDVFVFGQQYLGVPVGTIRAAVLIETISAAFQMDEILYELRDHSAGLTCGRWDYIFSFIKKLRNHPDWVLPERGDVTMEQPFLRSYVELLIHTCHKRGIHAMGGMAAQIPIRDDPRANHEAMERVREDKLREVRAGLDGTWVAHPALVPVAQEAFDEHMPEPNQIRMPPEFRSRINQADLLETPSGRISEAGLRRNIGVALRYIESWLRGNGCVPICNFMEDAATAEICRAQLWQWVRYGARMEDGRAITATLHDQVLEDMLEELSDTMGVMAYCGSKFDRAGELLREFRTGNLQEFLSTAAYRDLA